MRKSECSGVVRHNATVQRAGIDHVVADRVDAAGIKVAHGNQRQRHADAAGVGVAAGELAIGGVDRKFARLERRKTRWTDSRCGDAGIASLTPSSIQGLVIVRSSVCGCAPARRFGKGEIERVARMPPVRTPTGQVAATTNSDGLTLVRHLRVAEERGWLFEAVEVMIWSVR